MATRNKRSPLDFMRSLITSSSLMNCLLFQNEQMMESDRIQGLHRRICTVNEDVLQTWLNQPAGRLPLEMSK